MMPKREPIPYLLIAGAPYSGSTLLSFLLNAHPSCVSVGECNGLTAQVDPDTYPCSCGRILVECPFWRSMSQRMRDMGTPLDLRAAEWVTEFRAHPNRYLNFLCIGPLPSPRMEGLRNALLLPFAGVRRRLAQTARANAAFARAAVDIRGATAFVDGSKAPQRIRLLADAPGIDFRVVHLVRDARGGTTSFMKNSSLPLERAAREWRVRNRMTDHARRYVAKDRWMIVLYSDLCRDVQGTVDRIADFVGLPRAPIPDDFRSVEHHVVGNRMRMGGRAEISEDVSWKEALSSSDLAEIARRCGALNRRFGYPWPASS